MFNLQRTEKCFPNLLLEMEGLFSEDPVWGNPVWLMASLVILQRGCLSLYIFILFK